MAVGEDGNDLVHLRVQAIGYNPHVSSDEEGESEDCSMEPEGMDGGPAVC